MVELSNPEVVETTVSGVIGDHAVELIFADPYYASSEEECGRFVRELQIELAAFDPKVKVWEVNIGRSADWPAALVELFQIDWPAAAVTAIPFTLFFLGEKIQSNAKAWVEMASHLKRLLGQRPATRIDEKAALLLMLDQLSDEKMDLSNVKISVQVVEHVTLPNTRGTLAKRPEAVYLITVGSSGESHLFVVESNGNVALRRRFTEPHLQ